MKKQVDKNRKRSAEDVIRGFNYQFAATIRKILDAKDGSEITIEGVEDIDESFNDEIIKSVQCKYYEGTKLTNSILRDIVKPMMQDHKSRNKKINYHLYGHFKERVFFPIDDPTRFKNEVLVYKSGRGSSEKIGNVANDLGFTDDDIGGFLKNLKFEYTENYDSHRLQVEVALKRQFSCNDEEVKSFYYPFASSKVAELAARKKPNERKIRKSDFLKSFEARHKLFNHWLLREKGEDSFCKAMRRKFFSQSNISPFARFFIIECNENENLSELKSLTLSLCKKWSSHDKSTRQAPKDRYAPYLLFRNIYSATIAKLLEELHSEKIKLVDGYPFRNAKFSVSHISQVQTSDNELSLRILYEDSELEDILQNITHQTKEIYEFYRKTPFAPHGKVNHVQIPVHGLSTIIKII
jgi:hypothetical protein